MRARTQLRQTGSVLLLVLFVCLAVAVVIQCLCVAVMCAERAAVDESVGRTRLQEKDEGLARLRQWALTSWTSMPWTVLGEEADAVEGSVSELADSAGWLMEAAVRQKPEVSRLGTWAWLERGRDGVDLPLAALVAETVVASPGRAVPWMEVDGAAQDDGDDGAGQNAEAVGYVLTMPSEPVLEAGCSLVSLSVRWRLDPGWCELASATDVGAGPGVIVLSEAHGTERLPADCGGGTVDSSVLVVATGGVDLDARNRGDLYGVLVVDDGCLLLDGTTLHGAVFASGSVDLGISGRVAFSRAVLFWATERSLNRARLVPGTRGEGME